MSGIEAGFAKTPLGADLAAGVESISYNQVITFTLYKQVVLPLDNYVFWVKADLLGPSAAFNTSASFNTFQFNQATVPPMTEARTFDAKGSLHFSTEVRQQEDSTYVANRMVFTAEEEIADLNEIDPHTLWIADFEGVRFAFSGRSIWYKQANLWHYTGWAVYSNMISQVVDDPRQLNTRDVIVSNSLPAWLGLNSYTSVVGFQNTTLRLYPSFLVPNNIPPPYGTVHIFPENTRGLAMAPTLDGFRSHDQLCADRVRVTLYGLRNGQALDFIDMVNQYTLEKQLFGLMSTPVPQDHKNIQTELGTIAMKKTIDYDVSYNQKTIRDFAQKFILSSVPRIIVRGLDD